MLNSAWGKGRPIIKRLFPALFGAGGLFAGCGVPAGGGMYKIILAIFLAMPAAPAAAQPAAPTGEQVTFLRLLGAVQDTPEDAAARNKLLLHVRGMRSKPAIPAEAKRYYIRGMAIHIDATGTDDFDKAARAYNKALDIAPWWGQCYYNLAKALESAGRYDEAEEAMRDYKLLNVAPPEEAKLVSPAPLTAAPREDGSGADFRGAWGNGLDCWRYEFSVNAGQLVIMMRCWDFDKAVYGTGVASGRHFEGSSYGGPSGTGVGIRSPIRFKGDLGADNQSIEISTILAPDLADTEAALSAARDQVRMYGEPAWQKQTWRHMRRD